MGENVHDGHRRRFKEQFLKSGLEGFNSHQLLEMLLYYSIPRKDTNPLAHRLMDTFGSLSGVLEADYEELCRVEGITPHTAMLLTFCGKLFWKYYEDKYADGVMLTTTQDFGKYLLPRFFGMKNEAVILLSLDNRGKVLHCSTIFEGSVNATEISVRLILAEALRYNATAVVISHNHPNGHAVPSKEDLETTRILARALAMVEIRLLDHLVVAEDDYVSMRDTPAFAPLLRPVGKF